MSTPIGPVDERMMAQFMRTDHTDSSHAVTDLMAAAICADDPEITQAVSAAAMIYCSQHFEDFSESLDFPKDARKYVKLVLTASAVLMGNGALEMKKEREAQNVNPDGH
jgi:hypothetical protein